MLNKILSSIFDASSFGNDHAFTHDSKLDVCLPAHPLTNTSELDKHGYFESWHIKVNLSGLAQTLVSCLSQDVVRTVFDVKWGLSEETGQPEPYNSTLSYMLIAEHYLQSIELRRYARPNQVIKFKYNGDTKTPWSVTLSVSETCQTPSTWYRIEKLLVESLKA